MSDTRESLARELAQERFNAACEAAKRYDRSPSRSFEDFRVDAFTFIDRCMRVGRTLPRRIEDFE